MPALRLTKDSTKSPTTLMADMKSKAGTAANTSAGAGTDWLYTLWRAVLRTSVRLQLLRRLTQLYDDNLTSSFAIIDQLKVRIGWNQPYNGGSPVISYTVEFKNNQGKFVH